MNQDKQLLYKKSITLSPWWIWIIIVTTLATIFLTIGMTAQLVNIKGETTSLSQFISDAKLLGLNIDLFWIASNLPSEYAGTAVGLALTGFSLFMLDIFLILLYIVIKISTTNFSIQITRK